MARTTANISGKKPAGESAAKKAAGTKAMPAKGRNPKGGLTRAGRDYFRKRDGSNLKPGVTGAVDTPEKQKRKGSFLVRTFSHPRGPMVKDGQPTRLALSAHAWGEPVPKTEAAAKKLAVKGQRLLDRYRQAKGAKKAATKKSSAKAPSASKNKVTDKKTPAKKSARARQAAIAIHKKPQ